MLKSRPDWRSGWKLSRDAMRKPVFQPPIAAGDTTEIEGGRTWRTNGSPEMADTSFQTEGFEMNDDFRLKLIKIRGEKIAHRNELLAMKMQGVSAKEIREVIDLDGMIAREQLAIDNLDDTIARLS
ncbi:hypothetical protein [Rhizobium tropici]|nr:hypothetical protein [Rhizobium tropici]